MSRPASARAHQVARRRAGRRIRTSSTVARREASGRTTTAGSSARPARAGRSRAARVDAPSADRDEALAQHRRVEVGFGDLPHRDAQDGSCAPAPRRGPRAPWPAAGRASRRRRRAGRPGRGRCTVTRAPPRRARPRRDPPPRRTTSGTGTRLRRHPPAAPRPERGASACRARPRTRPARHVDQAFGEAARASASVSASSSASASASEHLGEQASTVAGSSGSRVVAVSASSRCQRTSSAIRSTASGVEAHPGRDGPGDRLAGHAVLGQAALADVVEQRGDQQHVGSRDVPDQRRGLDAGLDDVPVDGEAVDRRGVREQPDPLPLRQDPGQRARSPPGSPTPAAARARRPAGRTSSCRASSGHGVGQRRALAHQPGRGRRSQHDVALGGLGRGAQQQHRVLGRGGPAPSAPPRRARARRRARSAPAPAAGRAVADAGRASTASTRRQVSRERWVIRRPSSRTWLGGRGVVEPEAVGEVAHSSGATRSRGPPGRRRGARRGRRAAPAASARARRAARRPARWRPAP